MECDCRVAQYCHIPCKNPNYKEGTENAKTEKITLPSVGKFIDRMNAEENILNGLTLKGAFYFGGIEMYELIKKEITDGKLGSCKCESGSVAIENTQRVASQAPRNDDIAKNRNNRAESSSLRDNVDMFSSRHTPRMEA